MKKSLSILCFLLSTAGYSAENHNKVILIVEQIRRADYEGDRAALQRLYNELRPSDDEKVFGSRVRYWRGFAMWRRAINGFNESTDPKELEQDLRLAIDEFHTSAKNDPTFVDAKIGEFSCVGYIMFIHRPDKEQIQKLWAQAAPLNQDLLVVAPDNPRFIWVRGPMVWNSPPEKGGGQDKAIASYEKALQGIQNQKMTKSDPLEPTWGEPELMMNLSWSYLNRGTPDLKAAETYALGALKLVPYWHYVKDILLPQIREAKAKATPEKS